MLGSWTSNIEDIKDQFLSGNPFEHVVIENFFDDNYAEKLLSNFPKPNDSKWFKYHNPIEKKFAMNNFIDHPMYEELFSELQSDSMVNYMSQISDISNLEKDPLLHGAGIHYHSNGGKLDMHLDYSIHPVSKKERRLNLIIYMNKDWITEYHGDIQLWDTEFTGPVKRIYPQFNRAILFKTSDISWHGLPDKITCPENIGRKSIAIYYISEPRINLTQRFKATFRAVPWQKIDDRLQKLYDIRSTRIITTTDLENIYPNWENDF